MWFCKFKFVTGMRPDPILYLYCFNIIYLVITEDHHLQVRNSLYLAQLFRQSKNVFYVIE